MQNIYNWPEGTVLKNSFEKHPKLLLSQMEKWKTTQTYSGPEGIEAEKGSWYSRIWWWEPPKDSVPVQYCQDTSVHGLKYIAKPQQHISERIFWIVAFILGLVAAAILITDVWQRYRANPVIVTFQPRDLDTDRIPFPGVTICNFNKFPMSKVIELERIAADISNKQQSELAQKRLGFVKYVCHAQQSFSKEYNYADVDVNNDGIGFNDTLEDNKHEMLDFIFKETIPCTDLIRMCIFAERKRDCSELFKPIISDYGKCCTFNMLPIPLLLKDPHDKNKSSFMNITTGGGTVWSDLDLERWKQWDYKDGMVMEKKLYWPFRQKRAGVPYGLTVLLDANVEEYYCPSSDAEGFRFMTHTPLEMPHVRDFATIVGSGKEVYVEINPEVSIADDEVREFTREARECFFGDDQRLHNFRAYTGRNCIDDCIIQVITLRCNCSFFYMPRADDVRMCATGKHSADAKCIKAVKANLTDTVKEDCAYCDNLCEDITYHFQFSEMLLRHPHDIWKDSDLSDSTTNKIHVGDIPQWTRHKMSIVHVFLGSDTTVPILRRRLYGDTDLIASTGGVLGLCLGVSVLSAVEAIYFFTFRACFKFCRRNQIRGRLFRKINRIFTGQFIQKTRIITMDPDILKMYPEKNPVIDGDLYHRSSGIRQTPAYGFLR